MSCEIRLSRAVKKYKKCVAVNDVSLTIDKPMIYGLIGKNGAGKTTLLKLISGLARADSGEVICSSERGVGVLIENPGIFGHLSAKDNLLVKMRMTGCTDQKKAVELLEKVGLPSESSKKAGAFSLGMKQRLGIALALVGDPDILLLDEPINGLDPEGIIFVRDLLIELEKEKKIIIISSHMLEELSKIADRYGFLDNGVLKREFDKEELTSFHISSYMLLVDQIDKTCAILSDSGFRCSVDGEAIMLNVDESLASGALLKVLEGGVSVREFKRAVTPLEEIFMTGR